MSRQEIINMLQRRGMIDSDCRQTGTNCFEIACMLAMYFGYTFPLTEHALAELILRQKADMLWGNPVRMDSTPEALLLVYEPDYIRGFVSDVHVVFAHGEEEFNFGPGEDIGFTVSVRLPLVKQGGNFQGRLHNVQGEP